MDKKWIIIICVIILLAVGLIAFYSFSNQNNEISVASTKFQIPDGYHEVASNKDGVINLTNGTHEIFIGKYNDINVNKHIKTYVDYNKKKNITTNISNFTVGKTVVYKSNLNNSSAVHYWFVKNKNTYDIYSWNHNSEIDSKTIKLIESSS